MEKSIFKLRLRLSELPEIRFLGKCDGYVCSVGRRRVVDASSRVLKASHRHKSVRGHSHAFTSLYH